ncbi:6595_t:CDS:1, partial [Racocetra persica]
DLSKVEPFKSLPEVKPYENLLSFTKVRNSEADLIIKYQKLSEIIYKNKPTQILVYIDVKLNNIVIMTFFNDQKKNEKFLQE